MNIQIASDLHLEFPENREWLKENPLIPRGEVLLLAGDIICDKYKKKATSFYEKISKEFRFVISTPGNHEYYHGTIDYAYPFYKKAIAENHLKLNNVSYVIDDVKFIVTTLWSAVPDADRGIIGQYLNDYRLISHTNIYKEKYLITIDDTNKYHRMSLRYLKAELEKPFEGSIIVMTHHLPSYECVSDKFKKDKLNSAFTSDLNELITSHPRIKYWICGHSHDFHETIIGETKIIRNPLGYVCAGEEKDFKGDYVIDI
ncbi:MAG: metallophosphoesterase [Candidatus Cloacimonetes bacterium]|nr:metallophosphoesterase [Candidatus Cloacimonadota bacterium]